MGAAQARFPDEPSLTMLPGVTHEAAARLAEAGIASTAALLSGLQSRGGPTRRLLEQCLPSPSAVKDCLQVPPPSPFYFGGPAFLGAPAHFGAPVCFGPSCCEFGFSRIFSRRSCFLLLAAPDALVALKTARQAPDPVF